MRLWLLTALMLGAVLPSTAAAQLEDRPIPKDRPIGIVYQSDAGQSMKSSAQDDALTLVAVGEVEQSLRRLGYEVLPRAVVIQKLVDTDLVCSGGLGNCDPGDVLKALQLGAVVLVAIWWDRSPADMTIEVTTADAVGSAKGKLDTQADKRVPELVVAALDDLKNGKAADVQVYSVPVGAEVKLDGEVIGVSPVNAKARPGQHEVTLRYPDYVTTTKHFKVERGSPTVRVDVTMEPVGGRAVADDDAAMPGPAEASPALDYAIAAGLTVAAVALAIGPVKTLARDGECDHEVRRGACDRVNFGAGSGVMLGASALLLGGAVYLIVATPISGALSYDGERATVQVSGRF